MQLLLQIYYLIVLFLFLEPLSMSYSSTIIFLIWLKFIICKVLWKAHWNLSWAILLCSQIQTNLQRRMWFSLLKHEHYRVTSYIKCLTKTCINGWLNGFLHKQCRWLLCNQAKAKLKSCQNTRLSDFIMEAYGLTHNSVITWQELTQLQ